ncbi:Inner membrane protein yqaA [Kluyvera cryocrescens]|uniref:Inner membrane protein yqaA n=1 Tax=Kluyvera cryocrescens TaxID=580 RepID=A0A485ARM2_KLUCR|nr:Inner membrane protein yqaA [Kluyvera cryocrescens]
MGQLTLFLVVFSHYAKHRVGRKKAVGWLRRYGAATLLLSWMPVIGDLLCLLAGWMRISWGPVLFFLCLGKALRYVVVAALTLQGMTWWH